MNAPIPQSLTASPAWRALNVHAAEMMPTRIMDLFERDAERHRRFVCEDVGFYLDYSKQRVNGQTMSLLQSLARQQGLDQWRNRLFSGEHVNNTENRAALHMALRAPRVADFRDDGRRVGDEIHQVRQRMRAFAERVREGDWRGATGKRITDVVNIGIGGSDLGPRLLCTALAPQIDGPRPHFVANVDGAELHAVLARLRPETTLFVVVAEAAHPLAEVVLTAAAEVAAAAEEERHDRDAVAGRHVGHLGADRGDVRRELVAEDLRQLGAGQRVRLGRRDDRPGDVLVQVGAADPAPARADQDLGRAEVAGGLGHLLDADVLDAVVAGGAHHSPAPITRSPSGP